MKKTLFIIGLLAAILSGCANRGVGPQGGPKDSIAPYVVGEKPLNGMLNFHDKRVEISFNEYIQLDNVVENVLISPPQQRPPIVKAIGKRVIVTFEENLQDSTTYTINFGKAICDFTERNPIEGYTFSFSTGMSIDSLSIYGYVVNAENLNPVQGVIVGIHPESRDSFETHPFMRIGKSTDDGSFEIHNIRADNYRVYALRDNSRDYVYQPGEGLGFMEETIRPFCERHTHGGDTIQEGDSIIISPIEEHTEFGPADLVVWYFEEKKVRHYFMGSKREDAHRMQLVFSAEQEMPKVRALPPSVIDSTRNDSAWIDWTDYALWQSNKQNDTLICWLSDSLAIRQDTIVMELTYMKSDSVYNLEEVTDTIKLVYRAPRLSARAQEIRDKKARERKLRLKGNTSGSLEVYDTLRIIAEMPIKEIVKDSIHLYQKIDTTYKELAFELKPADSIHLSYAICYAYEPEQMYELRIDSAAVRDIYGIVNTATKIQTKVKSLEEYATLLIRLKDYDPRARIQLLNDKDVVVREKAAEEAGTRFEYLAAKPYYMRLYIDVNGDKTWTTGDWSERRQAEPVYYFPSKLSLRANWDFEETFDWLGIPQLDAKPDALLKTETGKKEKK